MCMLGWSALGGGWRCEQLQQLCFLAVRIYTTPNMSHACCVMLCCVMLCHAMLCRMVEYVTGPIRDREVIKALQVGL